MPWRVTPEQIDAILPQTQCGLCGYGGCMPYAKALVQQDAAINLCPPGGVKVLHKIADLVGKNALPYVQEMEQKAKPALLAVIREAECIGCAKCIQACPVDAIIGSAKQMHSVLTDECTGCELCVAPCPVDCIDMLVVGERDLQSANLARERFQAREKRLSSEEAERVLPTHKGKAELPSQDEKKSYVQAAIMRARLKKGSKD